MDLATSLAALNPAQLAAVKHTGSPLLVLASSGTGKTNVLTNKIATAIHSGAVKPNEIMAVTFTRKAAAELKSRVADMLPGYNIDEMYIGTFHAISSRILRAHQAMHTGEMPFTVVDTEDQKLLIGSLIDSLDHGANQFMPKERDNRIRNVVTEIDRLKSAGIDLADIDCPFATWPAHVRRPTKEMERILKSYHQQMRRACSLDYADLINDVLLLFRANPPLQDSYRRRFKMIIVDEYQDTNPNQEQWLQLFTVDGNNLTCVGDDDQSIYSWRGASSHFILTFPDRYENAQTMTLDVNYRSPPNIVQASHDLIRTNSNRHDKPTRASKSANGDVVALGRNGDHEIVLASVHEATIHNPSDVTIIVRTNAQAEVISEALEKAGAVTYRFNPDSDTSPLLRQYEAWLKVIANPSDNGAALRLINDLVGRDIARSLSRQAMMLGKTMIGYLNDKRASDSAMNPALQSFVDLRRSLAESASLMTNEEILNTVLVKTGIAEAIERLNAGAKARLLKTHLIMCQRAQQTETLAEVLNQSQLESAEAEKRPENAIAISTMHSMKGLETPIVIAPFWSLGDFPQRRDTQSNPDEAVRLAFVTLTRASRRFIAFYDKAKGPSPFLMKAHIIQDLPLSA